tara:strand:- start:505 stop:864 length:360 start_codon:yes stop_codon:yes gene_type:complete
VTLNIGRFISQATRPSTEWKESTKKLKNNKGNTKNSSKEGPQIPKDKPRKKTIQWRDTKAGKENAKRLNKIVEDGKKQGAIDREKKRNAIKKANIARMRKNIKSSPAYKKTHNDLSIPK